MCSLHPLPSPPLPHPQVLPVSSIQGEGLERVWSTIMEYKTAMETAGLFDEKRRSQRDAWVWSYVDEELLRRCVMRTGWWDMLGIYVAHMSYELWTIQL